MFLTLHNLLNFIKPFFLVPLFRLNRVSDNYKFFAAGETEAKTAETNYGFVRTGTSGLVVTNSLDCLTGTSLKPVYRLYNSDHIFTACESEARNAIINRGYRDEGIRFYCTISAGEFGATVPIYKFSNGKKHFYTTDMNEGNTSVVAAGGIYEGVLCYIWPPK